MDYTARRVLLLASALLFAPPDAIAQEKLWRIGVLETTPRSMNAANMDALRKGLNALGYVEGRNLVIHYRSVDGKAERFKELAGDLVHEKVDLIVTRGTTATKAAMNATTTIPIVMTSSGSPVRSGLVKSLARPGANVTGLSGGGSAADLSGKRVELLKEIFPRTMRIGYLANMGNLSNHIGWPGTQQAAGQLGIQVQLLDVRRLEDLEPAFEAARKGRVNALIVAVDTVTQTYRGRIAELSLHHRLPAIGGAAEFAAAGILLSYARDISSAYLRAATYIDKILKGANPGDLPVEEPAAFELLINLKTAAALGVKIPAPVRFRADKLIE